MSKYIKLTEDNVQEYINTIYSVMHDEDKINIANIVNFELATRYKNENDKLLAIIDMLSELAFLNSSE